MYYAIRLPDENTVEKAMVAVITGKNYLIELEIFVHQRKYYIVKCWICMQQVWTTTLVVNNPFYSLKLCKMFGSEKG